jgi:hypothetical protein
MTSLVINLSVVLVVLVVVVVVVVICSLNFLVLSCFRGEKIFLFVKV